MKKIALIYCNRENTDAINYLEEEIESIFGKWAVVDNYYVNELCGGGGEHKCRCLCSYRQKRACQA